MPIIGKVGRSSKSVRFLNSVIHVILLLGAITMVYPFLIMVSSSFKSPVDSKEFNIVPQFFFSEEMQFKKFVEARYNEESRLFTSQYKDRFLSFENLTLPISPIKEIYDDWWNFLHESENRYNEFDFYVAEQYGRGIYPRNERKFRRIIKKEFDGDLDKFNSIFDESALTWDNVRVEEKDILSRKFGGDYTGMLPRYRKFRKTLPLWQKIFASLDGNFINTELFPKFAGDLNALNEQLGTQFTNWSDISLSRDFPKSNKNNGSDSNHRNALEPFWINYVKESLNIHHIGVEPEALNSYRKFLFEKYSDIPLLNKTYKTNYSSFSSIVLPEKIPDFGAMFVDWSFFIENVVNAEFLYIKSVSFDFRDWLKKKYGSIDRLNSNYKKGYSAFDKISLPSNFPAHNLQLQTDWDKFVRTYVDMDQIKLSPLCQKEFTDYISKIFVDENSGFDITEFNYTYGTSFEKAINIYPAPTLSGNERYKKDWSYFVKEVVSPQFIEIIRPVESDVWQEYLKSKYNTIGELNKSYSLIYSSFADVEIENWVIDYYIFKENHGKIFREFFSRNYQMVLDVMLYNGRAIVNTLLYCILAILAAITINPLAAYAMSRFKLRSTYKIILVLMLTMAFPPMVMGIPNFLLLKKLSLLNTFWALILPAAADGYFIFLLKGFFDSLPQELFECATIDGAGEFRIFWQIAMSLSKPIMAVIALGAFNAAYRNFMFAFIVCQDKSMWTMMVQIYQLIQRSSKSVGFAALVIAAIPTLLVFIFFQNIIIRGIVVPTEK